MPEPQDKSRHPSQEIEAECVRVVGQLMAEMSRTLAELSATGRESVRLALKAMFYKGSNYQLDQTLKMLNRTGGR